MKTIIIIFFTVILFTSKAYSKETNYTASTPADRIVRAFLGISQTDSIDFIRWKLTLTDLAFRLECNYGIGKPNTNGFNNGGKKVAFTGSVKRETNKYILQHKNRLLKLAELNTNLLHILNEDNSLLIGSAGWSYAINNITPFPSPQSKLASKQIIFKDSMAFQGRTPCGVPGIIPPGKTCYKLKWYLVFYELNTYRILGTGYRVEGGKKGTWKTISNKEGKAVYQLNDENGNPFIYLLKLDDGVLIFLDEKENLLVGDLDFSYTLNRKF